MSYQLSNSIFSSHSTNIRTGDTVIVYHSRDNLSAIVVRPGQVLRSRYGEFPHDDMVGIPFGSKCTSSKGNGFTYLLRPTPELWTLALPHRTQILYLPDIAYVTGQLDLKPGSVVIEAGTGSGSFSHSVARTIGDHGKLFSFEFHEERFTKAEAEFRLHGLLASEGGPIRLQHRNVIKNGFGDLDQEKVDAIFLDLPAPWDALADAKRVMNRAYTSRICCFSPCMEQVQKTCQTLQALGFAEITMFETLLRTHEPASVPMPTVANAVSRIREVERKKELRRERQIAEAKARKEAESGESKVATEELESKPIPGVKRPRTESSPLDGTGSNGAAGVYDSQQAVVTSSIASTTTLETCKPAPMSRGHTSFLTFAILLPESVPESVAPQEEPVLEL
ncbi:hypothetical protein CROQUDRAFT_66037 [Cronartium quercuum f. sp. fusiforme G11]|uniref:tRNA (adenine(58)-N(1))-methyltransferase catalytic subunit TRM61 n=1 Tax=Cronartium quercuum f. sp. fusiforme G11 TaxID=708437 RepID=A0A9P6NH87_9BASI|nr:hypothetical protein CROQUDRAFT_66037 [Cronartium quercuum f. sp. fusiforme G11]